MAISFIVKRNVWYDLYDADGKKYKTLSASSIGNIISVAGNTFIVHRGVWVDTYDHTGKKINTRAK